MNTPLTDTHVKRLLSAQEEMKAMEQIYRTIHLLSHQSRTRILDWLVSRLEQDRNEDAVIVPMGQSIGGDRG
jgi:hypothetical protein